MKNYLVTILNIIILGGVLPCFSASLPVVNQSYLSCPSPGELNEKISLIYRPEIKKCRLQASHITMKHNSNSFFSIETEMFSTILINQNKCPRRDITILSTDIEFKGVTIYYYNPSWVNAKCHYSFKKQSYRTNFSLDFDIASVVKNWRTCKFKNFTHVCHADQVDSCRIYCQI